MVLGGWVGNLDLVLGVWVGVMSACVVNRDYLCR